MTSTCTFSCTLVHFKQKKCPYIKNTLQIHTPLIAVNTVNLYPLKIGDSKNFNQNLEHFLTLMFCKNCYGTRFDKAFDKPKSLVKA